MARITWEPVLVHAATSSTPTTPASRCSFLPARCRATFAGTHRATTSTCRRHTAKGRREGHVPRPDGQHSRIAVPLVRRSSRTDAQWLRDIYRRDRTDGQPWTSSSALRRPVWPSTRRLVRRPVRHAARRARRIRVTDPVDRVPTTSRRENGPPCSFTPATMIRQVSTSTATSRSESDSSTR